MDGAEFRDHRQRVVETFKASSITEGLIVYESPKQAVDPLSNCSVPFYQDGFFYWLTGWPEPDNAIIIDIATGESVFLLHVYLAEHEIWWGSVPTADSVLATTGADRIEVITNLAAVIASFSPSIIFTTTAPISFAHATIDRHTLLTAAGIARREKSRPELETLRRASTVTGECIVEVLKWARWSPTMTERKISAYFEFQAAVRGCPHFAFPTIAGACQTACYLHNENCAGPVRAGDLVLLDCGVYYDHYAGDITRTFPISGKFSPEQATVYGALLTLQKRLISDVKPGLHWKYLFDSMYRGIFAIAQELGVLAQGLEYDWKLADFFVPHGLSHHIGCNPHDHCGYENEDSKITESIHRQYTLAPGHVISIEPGIYFHLRKLEQIKPDEAPLNQINIARATELANAVGAIRIEDDVAVTEDGADVLSAICPKEIAEIESLLAKGV